MRKEAKTAVPILGTAAKKLLTNTTNVVRPGCFEKQIEEKNYIRTFILITINAITRQRFRSRGWIFWLLCIMLA